LIVENELLFALARKDFKPEHQTSVFELCGKAEIKWDILFLTALQHQVAPFVYSNLSKCPQLISKVPPKTLKEFKFNILQIYCYQKKQEKDIVTALSNFNRKSVDVMLVKGAALNFTIYQNIPGYIIGDIDLILRNKRQDVTNQEDQEDINFFQELNINEWERFKHHDIDMNGLLAIDFEKIWNRAIETTFGGQKVFVMSPEDMLLAACINSRRKRFFRLKSLCDIREVINYYKDLNWDKFTQNVREYHCDSIVYTSLLVTSMTVGCELPKEVFNKLSISFFRTPVIRHLIGYLRNNVPLAFLLPSSGVTIWQRNVNPSLLLIFATYSWFQIFRKFRLALSAMP
jgi:hypothetical protein